MRPRLGKRNKKSIYLLEVVTQQAALVGVCSFPLRTIYYYNFTSCTNLHIVILIISDSRVNS
jgi:hypothetical protein